MKNIKRFRHARFIIKCLSASRTNYISIVNNLNYYTIKTLLPYFCETQDAGIVDSDKDVNESVTKAGLSNISV